MKRRKAARAQRDIKEQPINRREYRGAADREELPLLFVRA